MRTPFFGPFNVSRSPNFADQKLINLMPIMNDQHTAKDVGMFLMAPGLDLVVTVGSGPIRGMRYVVHQNLVYVVSGNQVFTLDQYNRTNLIGTIGTATGPVSMIDNETQVALFDGAVGYYNKQATNLLFQIALPFTGGPVSANVQDDCGVVSVQGTQSWYQSNLGDFSTWQALNFGVSAGEPDDIQSIVGIHREMWLIKNFTIEVWVNAGLNGFIFQQLQGIFMEVATPAPYSPAVIGEGIAFLSQNRQGQFSVCLTEGYRAVRISTDALDTIIQSYSVISDAIGYSYAQEGHQYYVLTFPTANATWVYDATLSAMAKSPMWHQRASLSNGIYNRHWGNCGVYFNGKHLVGDYRNGNVYSYDLDQPLDNGTQRKWVRSWRALPQPAPDVTQFNSLMIDMETGIQDPPTAASPVLMLRWSDDGGHNWTPYLQGSANALGVTATRVMFRRLGSTRRSSGLDRIFELSSSDRFKVALIGAELA